VASTETSDLSWRHWVAVTLMSLTTILAAWSAFESSKWSGVMSISFSQASSARIEAARYQGDANRAVSIQVGLFTQWVNAYAAESEREADYLASVFPEPLKTSFDAWVLLEPDKNPEVPRTPFSMPEYQLQATADANAADDRADQKFAEALESNQRSDNYTLMAVLFAVVLFFTALSGRARSPRIAAIYLGFALVLFFVSASFLLTFPKLI
jgi:hypothetical protein